MKRLIFIVFILLSFGVKAQNYSSSGRPAGLTSFSPTWGINAFSPDSGKSIWMSFGTKWFRIPTFVQSKYFDSNFRLSADSVHLADTIKKTHWLFLAPQYLGATQLFNFSNSGQGMSGVGSIYTAGTGVNGLRATIGVIRHSDAATAGMLVDTPGVVEFTNYITGKAPKLHANYDQTDPLSLITRHVADSLIAATAAFDSNFRVTSDSIHLADNIHIGISTIPAWNSVYKVLNMAGNVGIRSHTGAHDLGLFNNLYNTTGSTTWHYSATGRGSLFYLDNSGGMNFYTAAPGTSADSVVLASPIFSVTPNGATLTTLPDTTAIDTIVGIHSGKLYKTPFTGGGSDSTIYKRDGTITDAVRTVTLKANSDLYIGDITSGNGFHLQRLADSSMYAAIVGGDKTGNTYGTFYAGSDGGITAEAASGSIDRYIRIGPGALTGGGGMLIHDSDNIGLQNNADYSTNERLNRNALASIKAVIGIADSVKSTISGGGVTSFNSRTGAVVPVAGDYASLTETLTNKNLTSGTNTFPTFNQNTTGQAGSVANTLTNGPGILSFSYNGGTTGIKAAADTNYVGLAQDMILSGMGVTLSGTTATVAAGSYRLNQATHSVSSTGVTIPAQDATLNRYTLIVGNTSGTLSAINGTLATDAVVPALPSNDILISTIYIPSVASGGGATSGGGAGKGTTTNSLNGGYGIVPFSFNGGTSGIKVVSDTTKIQTIANYYPKGDLRYYKATNPSNYIALSALSATSPIFYNSSTGVISSQAASASQNGYLTSTDWSTFNGKESVLTFNTGLTRTSNTVKSDTTVLQTIANFFPKGDTRYLKSSVISGLANPTASIGLSAVNGSATTAMRSDAAQALSQAITPTWTGKHTFSITNTASSGNNQGTLINHTVNQTGTAAFTDLLINRTNTAAGSGPQLFLDLQIGSVSKLRVDVGGSITTSGNVTANGTFYTNDIQTPTASSPLPLQDIHNTTTGIDLVNIGSSSTNTASSGIYRTLSVFPNINQSGTAGYRALWISEWESGTGSGVHNLIDVGTNTGGSGTGTYTSKFSVTNTGIINSASLTTSAPLQTDGNSNLISSPVGQTTLVSGTKAITITGLTTSSKAFVTLVSVGGTVTTTWQYAAVCTANTLTITALTNSNTTNTSDTSIINYEVVQ